MIFVILPTKVNALNANVILKQVMALVTRDLALKNRRVHQVAPHSSKAQGPATSLSAHQENLMLQEVKKSCILVAPTTPQWKGESQSETVYLTSSPFSKWNFL